MSQHRIKEWWIKKRKGYIHHYAFTSFGDAENSANKQYPIIHVIEASILDAYKAEMKKLVESLKKCKLTIGVNVADFAEQCDQVATEALASHAELLRGRE